MGKRTGAEYLVYRARVVQIPETKKSLVRPESRPATKEAYAVQKKNRKTASLNPDLEKNRKNSVVMKTMIAYKDVLSS
jgi:hypothetical protein